MSKAPSKSRSNESLELEIHALLKQYGAADLAADALSKKYQEKKIALFEFEVIAGFLLAAGFWATLVDFCIRKLADNHAIPWGHFSEALFLSTPMIEPEIKTAIVQGAEDASALEDLARSQSLDHFDERLKKVRQQRHEEIVKNLGPRKNELLQNLEILQSQGMVEAEEKLLEQLAESHPNDPEVQELKTQFHKRVARQLITAPLKALKEVQLPFHVPRDPETQNLLDQIEGSMTRALKKTPGLCADFALAQLQFDYPEAALRLLSLVPADSHIDWLKSEALLKGRRFVELLAHLTYMENSYGVDPENTFAVNYFRAQALWALSQKHQALELMESLVAARPSYRAAHALLHEWKGYVL